MKEKVISRISFSFVLIFLTDAVLSFSSTLSSSRTALYDVSSPLAKKIGIKGVRDHRQDWSMFATPSPPKLSNNSNNDIPHLENDEKETTVMDIVDSTPKKSSKNIGKRIYHLYMDYLHRLWNETDPRVRKRIATAKAISSLKRVQHIMRGEEYVTLSKDQDTFADIEERQEARSKLLQACDVLLKDEQQQQQQPQQQSITATTTKNDAEKPSNGVVAPPMEKKEVTKKKKKKGRSVLFGASMGAVVACWVFSGNYIFTALFTLMTALGQLEYYRMVMNAGIYPARRISILGACSMFLTVSTTYIPIVLQSPLSYMRPYLIQWNNMTNFFSSSFFFFK